MAASRDLVVAHYREDLSWLNNISECWNQVVYTKSPDSTEGIPLENVGREAHTYLHHIIEQYGAFPEWTMFCQGNPFDHAPEFHRILNMMSGDCSPSLGFLWFGLFVDYEVPDGSRLFRTWSKNEDGRGLDLTGFWKAVFSEEVPDRIPFFPGACFAVHRDVLMSQSLEFYQNACKISVSFPDAEHCYERCWDDVFGVRGVPEAVKEGELPLYLRPVKRLGITWETRGYIPDHPFYEKDSPNFS